MPDVTATINGEPRTVRDGLTVAELLAELELGTEGIAVAVDGRVVRRATFSEVALRDGDAIEIIRAVAGG
jgi:thiamine biosynthesis protein ThiS